MTMLLLTAIGALDLLSAAVARQAFKLSAITVGAIVLVVVFARADHGPNGAVARPAAGRELAAAVSPPPRSIVACETPLSAVGTTASPHATISSEGDGQTARR
jgi:hypothetical protein